jgi:fumarate reductase flavoprotein subunit
MNDFCSATLRFGHLRRRAQGFRQINMIDSALDLVIVGAGTAGMPCAIEAVAAGLRVAVIEKTPRPGGTLHVSLGQMSGAGTALQRDRGIADDPQAHLDDILRINRGTGRRDILERTVPLQGETIDWLMSLGFEMDPDCPVVLHLHEAYRTARTYWGREGGRSVLKAILPPFSAAMAQPNARLLTGHRALSLAVEDRRVAGVVVESEDGQQQTLRAGAVVLATGGYGANPAMFAKMTGGRTLYTAAMPSSQGEGIAMAEAIGAEIVGRDLFLPTYAGIVSEPGGHQVLWRQMPNLTPQVRAPWELHLDCTGRRFVREDDPSVDAREHALNERPDLSFWCVFDDAVLEAAPPLLPGWSDQELSQAWHTHPSFVRAHGVEALAAATGMNVQSFKQSLKDYAAACRGERPDPMGRLHCPRPIEGPNFRAIRMHGMVLKTPAGVRVNDSMQACRADGSAIEGLHVIGEAIGGSTLSGQGFVSGMSVTPSLALGRWLGHRLGQRLVVSRAA